MLFVDTAAWVSAADASDPRSSHVREAPDTWLAGGGVLVTTDYVIDETLTTIRFRIGLDASEKWWHQVEGSSRLRLEVIDVSRAERARSIFFRYGDKDFSFTDCTSFVLMNELRLCKALTLDHHFQQMGFEVIPEV